MPPSPSAGVPEDLHTVNAPNGGDQLSSQLLASQPGLNVSQVEQSKSTTRQDAMQAGSASLTGLDALYETKSRLRQYEILLETQNKQNESLREQFTQAQKQLGDTFTLLQSSQNESSSFLQEIRRLEKEYAELQEELAKSRSLLSAEQAHHQQNEVEEATLREELQQERRDLVASREQSHRDKRTIQDLEEQLKEERSLVAMLQQQLEEGKTQPPTPTATQKNTTDFSESEWEAGSKLTKLVTEGQSSDPVAEKNRGRGLVHELTQRNKTLHGKVQTLEHKLEDALAELGILRESNASSAPVEGSGDGGKPDGESEGGTRVMVADFWEQELFQQGLMPSVAGSNATRVMIESFKSQQDQLQNANVTLTNKVTRLQAANKDLEQTLIKCMKTYYQNKGAADSRRSSGKHVERAASDAGTTTRRQAEEGSFMPFLSSFPSFGSYTE
ncbi:hypothetical protein CYMTET_46320 [Cymbomonas tetramitiformis]|uniref:Uncharacterized protein n=1 Tax=Cymbomonas tetramitiformis TaxID=36881 RepID=A0AAE0BYA8_9CHLO|nr:hypothetical protein CYMTET_46320 [Cymbomonas tetramitiformis]